MSQLNTTYASLEMWQAQTLRLTAFPSPSARISNPTWWVDIIGEEPENIQSRPKEGIHEESGTYGEGKLTLVVKPTRIDWLFTPNDRVKQEEDIPAIGIFPKTLDRFLRIVHHWLELETCPAVQRLAFGAVLLHPVPDRQSGYKLLGRFLQSVKLDPEQSSEFMYRINRPRDSISGISGLRINRLSTWHISSLRGFHFSIGSGSTEVLSMGEYVACQLEMDINTIPDFQGELPRAKLPQIFNELVELGKEIAIKGDIP